VIVVVVVTVVMVAGRTVIVVVLRAARLSHAPSMLARIHCRTSVNTAKALMRDLCNSDLRNARGTGAAAQPSGLGSAAYRQVRAGHGCAARARVAEADRFLPGRERSATFAGREGGIVASIVSLRTG
jgi:hypothetical protein